MVFLWLPPAKSHSQTQLWLCECVCDCTSPVPVFEKGACYSFQHQSITRRQCKRLWRRLGAPFYPACFRLGRCLALWETCGQPTFMLQVKSGSSLWDMAFCDQWSSTWHTAGMEILLGGLTGSIIFDACITGIWSRMQCLNFELYIISSQKHSIWWAVWPAQAVMIAPSMLLSRSTDAAAGDCLWGHLFACTPRLCLLQPLIQMLSSYYPYFNVTAIQKNHKTIEIQQLFPVPKGR